MNNEGASGRQKVGLQGRLGMDSRDARGHPGGGQLGDGTQAAEPSHPRPSQATLEQPTGGQALLGEVSSALQ